MKIRIGTSDSLSVTSPGSFVAALTGRMRRCGSANGASAFVISALAFPLQCCRPVYGLRNKSLVGRRYVEHANELLRHSRFVSHNKSDTGFQILLHG